MGLDKTDQNTTTMPPCGFEGVWYHVECISKLQDTGNWRCPHCNVALDESIVIGSMGKQVEQWMGKKEQWWAEKARYFAIHHGGLPQEEEEESTLARVFTTLIEKMKKSMCYGCVQVSQREDDLCVFSCLIGNINEPCRFAVTLRRTAYYGEKGCILCDGYLMGATRSRTSRRTCLN